MVLELLLDNFLFLDSRDNVITLPVAHQQCGQGKNEWLEI